MEEKHLFRAARLIGGFALSLLAFYMTGALVAADMDIVKWGVEGRFVAFGLGVPLSALLSVMVEFAS